MSSEANEPEKMGMVPTIDMADTFSTDEDVDDNLDLEDEEDISLDKVNPPKNHLITPNAVPQGRPNNAAETLIGLAALGGSAAVKASLKVAKPVVGKAASLASTEKHKNLSNAIKGGIPLAMERKAQKRLQTFSDLATELREARKSHLGKYGGDVAYAEKAFQSKKLTSKYPDPKVRRDIVQAEVLAKNVIAGQTDFAEGFKASQDRCNQIFDQAHRAGSKISNSPKLMNAMDERQLFAAKDSLEDSLQAMKEWSNTTDLGGTPDRTIKDRFDALDKAIRDALNKIFDKIKSLVPGMKS